MKKISILVVCLWLLSLTSISLISRADDYDIIDFETAGSWIASGTGQGKFEIGIPVAFSASGGECRTTCLGTGPSGDHSEIGVNAACTNLDGHMAQFETSATNSLTSPIYDFSGITNVNLELWRFMEIESNNYDFCYFQYKNSQAGQWVNFETYGATRIDDNSWVRYTKNLSSFAGSKSYFQLRFYCTTDDWTEGSGLCIDDITITDVKPCVPDCQGYVCGMDPVCGTLNCDNPGCAGGDKCENGICRQPSKGIILVQLDDTSPSELNTANLIVEKFHDEGIAITPELWPAGLSNSPLLDIALLWDSWPEIEIAQGVYSGDSCGGSLVADIQKGKLEYAAAGITQPTSYLPHMCYPSSSALDGLRDEGILIVIDYIGPDVVRNGDPSEPSQQPLTIDGGRDIASNGVDSYATVLSSVKSQIAAKGYADLAFHIWIIDQSTSQKIITIMKQLRDEGYTFMAATQYYRSLWRGGSSCGNGILETGEECDDGNLVNGDGCSGDCRIELSACVDEDGDDYYAIGIGCLMGNDCNDTDVTINPGASETECDNINNDCDNLIDENYASQPTTCGVGACYSTGSTSCVAGSVKDSCIPGQPQPEVCEGSVDEDCDGKTDLDDSDCRVCGDGICNSYENCSSCQEDCGECSVKTLIIRPAGQGSRRGWSNIQCSSLNEWQCVNEDPPATLDYLRDSRTAKETFTFSNTGLSDGTINSITLFYYAQWYNNQANSCFESMVRVGRKEHFTGIQMCVGGSWGYVSHKYTENPSTNLPWTIAEVDALEAGMHSLNPNGGGRVAQVYAVVEYTQR